ncbi:MAG: hypothetical protein ABEJ68_11610 [Halobacteriaceae archaeon]
MEPSRRDLLTTLGSVGAATVLAGCSSGGDSGSASPTSAAGPERGPVETFRQFNTALKNGNEQKAKTYLHPDWNTPVEDMDSAADPSVRLLEQSDTEATVEVDSEQVTVHIIMRVHDGEWKIYDSE